MPHDQGSYGPELFEELQTKLIAGIAIHIDIDSGGLLLSINM